MAATTRTDTRYSERPGASIFRLAHPPDCDLPAAHSRRVIVLVPFAWMLSTSLKTQDQLFTTTINLIPNPAVPQNYVDVWARLETIAPGMNLLRIVGNTLFITILAMVGEIFSASIVAYGFSRFQWRGRDALFAIMLATVMIPSIITRIPGLPSSGKSWACSIPTTRSRGPRSSRGDRSTSSSCASSS